ncbi:hypothetical protein MTR67_001808 [Solanum verrucosum]|uniref:Transposase-associated domain-containing protein n=1 Tax=Solanum verrucosum TaxID=315347 RepID=A0AAF0T8S3_SOLVR|nr:hypothetical protein MTR67_001808 [Solanum verrucosum]
METASSNSSPFQKTTPITPVEYTIGNLPRHRVYRQDPATEPEMVRPIGIRMPIEAPIKLQDGGDRGKILNIAAHDPQLWNSVIDVWKGIVVADYIHHYSETDAETMYRYMETFLGESIKGMWEAYKMNPDRSWMYNRNNPGRAGMIPEFAEGVTRFINHAMTLDDFLNSRLIRCPCVNCENVRYHTTETVAMHLMMNGFKPGYTVWTSHGEVESDTMFNNFVVSESSRSTEHNYFQGSRMSDMINDAFGMHSDFEQGENVEEAPNEGANIFYEQLHDCSSPLFNGSQHSKLSVAVRLLSIKSDNNISQGAMDSMIELMKELVDPNVEIPDSYYKANALVSKLGLSSIRIDCCEKGCMLYYKEVENKRYAALQAQLTFPFESGNILPLCPASSDGSDQEGDENDKESEGDEE